MPIQFPDFPMLTFEQANPELVGAQYGQKFMQNIQDMRAKMLANQIAQVNAKYAEPNAAAALTTAQQHNLYDPKVWQSEINLRAAQGGLAGKQGELAEAEAAKARFMTAHPEYINPDAMMIQQALAHQQQGGQQANPQVQQPSSGVNPSQIAAGIQQSGAAPSSGGLPQPQAPQYSPSQYAPDAMAFSPPNLPSPTGNPAMDNLYFKRYGMSPVIQAQMELAKTNAQKYQDQLIDRNKQFNNEAAFSNESTINAHKFLDALSKSSSLERGYFGGQSPAISDAAQNMESSGNNMAAAATKLFDEGRAVHASDIALQQMAKPNRKQNQDVSFDLAQGVIAKNDRLKERQQFFSYGSQLGLKPQILDSMWNKYETERPYINPETHLPNDAYAGSWHDYLNPEAVNSFTQGGNYIPPNNKQLEQMNFSKDDLKSINSLLKKKGEKPIDNKKLFEIANKEKIPLSQVKMELVKSGVLK